MRWGLLRRALVDSVLPPSRAAQDWARQNAEVRAHPFCQCGAPATIERRIPTEDGYSINMVCDAHKLVNGWTKDGDGPWVPHQSELPSWWVCQGTSFVRISKESASEDLR